MQQGMLFHTVSAPDSDVYVQQLSCRLAGTLDVAAFAWAWEELARRHAVLRTAFAWHGLPEPLQVVGAQVRVPLDVADWRDLTHDAQAERLRALCIEERTKGFDLRRAPLMRLRLVQLSESEHQLVWTWHHVILDAWSVPILIEELFAMYESRCEGSALDLAPSRPYRDFIGWQRAQDLSAAEAFWRSELDGFRETTPLGIDDAARRATGDETGYGLEFLEIPEPEVDALREAARRAHLTINTLVQGAWALLLSRYSGRDDVLFGTAVAGRPPELEGAERIVGLTINTLPVRIQVPPWQRLGEWLQHLQQRQAETRRYEHASLLQVQAWSSVPRGTQLFDSLLVFENAPVDLARMQGRTLRLERYDLVERANFPLTVMMEVRTRSKVGVGYDRARFDRASMLRMLAHLRTLLAEMAGDHDRTLADLDYLTTDERAQLLGDWSRGPGVPHAEAASIPRLFEQQAAATPDAPAATFAGAEGDVTLTYRALNEQANACARWLRSLGVGSQDRVVICADASLTRLAAILGVMKAGATYVPMETSMPAARLRGMIADCGAKLVLAQPELVSALTDGLAARVLALDAALGDFSTDDLPDAPDPDALAYIIYTSGSTGSPKGVAVTHRSLQHLVAAQIEAFRIDASSNELQFASLSFDASISEIFTALLAGARLLLAPRQLLVPSRDMLALMERLQITTVTLPPSVLSRLPESALPSLRTLVSAGEPCSAELASRWAAGRLFLNAYGPTEVTVCATIGEVSGDGTRPSIGRPMGDARVYVLDAQMRPVAIGVAGELYVGGPGIARGYWNRPELTAASFIPDPFSSEPGRRLYRTGDMVRFLPNRDLDFLGRRDEQVKVRGFRIELAEVESALHADPSLREAAVIAEGERLIAYVVPKPRTAAEWWPSIAEYFVYDELAYHAMTSDERRNESYRAAIRGKVRNKVVVEVGTGPEALLARFCAEAGARKVYAIELLPDSYEKASQRVRDLGLTDRIEVILGDATKIMLPEPAEVCVSEIVGAIGGCEGAAAIINNVRHLLTGDAAMIPERSRTLYAPVQLPAELVDDLAFRPLPTRYVEKIFAEVGHPFDLRLCVKGLDRGHLLGEPQVFEDLDFRRLVDPEVRHQASHRIERDGRLDGFLVWLTLDTGGGETIDILDHEHCWLPVFLPLFAHGIEVSAGDRIESLSFAVLPRDGRAPHPDYSVEGSIHRQNSEPIAFRISAPRHGDCFRDTPFYDRFFRNGDIPRAADRPARAFDPTALKDRLRQRLPEHMVPDVFIPLAQLPLMASGKLDRRGLPAATVQPKREAVPPRNEAEKNVAAIWQELLQTSDIGLQTNFFDHGGHSLLLLRVQDRIKQQMGIDVSVTDLFKHPTVETLARRLAQHGPEASADRAGHQRAAARQQALGRIAERRKLRPSVGKEDAP
jgi:amino acid adenylation domain-containing protein